MREINTSEITEVVAKLCQDTNYYIAPDIKRAFEKSVQIENGLSKEVMETLLENAEIAKEKQIPICQDTGMVVVYIEVGQDVKLVGEYVEDAINNGVRKGYEEGYLRKSVVADPINRVNTKDNTPAVIHYKIVKGDKVKIVVSPKGFGSENMSSLTMLKPSQGIEGVKQAILNTIKNAGPNPCPPIVVGVGIGGTMEKASLMSKQALFRDVDSRSQDEYWANMEDELLTEINNLGIGPSGFGGKTTALAVNINTYPTHIAGLPVAVNIGCHVTRHGSAEL